MDMVLQIVAFVTGITALVCHIIVIVKMFQNGATGLGIAAIVLSLLCCIPGYIFTLIFGWIRSGEWNLKTIMLVYTAALVINIAAGALNPAPYKQFQEQLQQQTK